MGQYWRESVGGFEDNYTYLKMLIGGIMELSLLLEYGWVLIILIF